MYGRSPADDPLLFCPGGDLMMPKTTPDHSNTMLRPGNPSVRTPTHTPPTPHAELLRELLRTRAAQLRPTQCSQTHAIAQPDRPAVPPAQSSAERPTFRRSTAPRHITGPPHSERGLPHCIPIRLSAGAGGSSEAWGPTHRQLSLLDAEINLVPLHR